MKLFLCICRHDVLVSEIRDIYHVDDKQSGLLGFRSEARTSVLLESIAPSQTFLCFHGVTGDLPGATVPPPSRKTQCVYVSLCHTRLNTGTCL